INRDPRGMSDAARLVHLRADAVELVLAVKRTTRHRPGRLLRRLLRRGEHELDRVEQAELRDVALVVFCQHRDLVDVADEELAALDGGEALWERPRHAP